MEHLTYHQLLAEVYDESSKNLLVHETEYEDDEIPPEDKHPDELEEQEEFQKQQPAHSSVVYKPNALDYSDKTKLSVQYEKQVLTHVINIDSRFRDFYVGNPGISANINFKNLSILNTNNTSITTSNSISTDFTYVLPIPIKNAISVRMSSIEFPNTFYTFSEKRGNTTFYLVIPSGSTNPLNKRLIKVPDGNYIDINLASLVQTLLNNTVSSITNTPGSDAIPAGTVFSVLIDGGNATTAAAPPAAFTTTGRVTISTNTIANFDLLLGEDIYGSRTQDFGLGHYLGFRNKIYTGLNSYITESIIDTTDWPYVFVSLNPDWKVVHHQNQTTNSKHAFAKVMMNSSKNSIIFSNNSNTVTTEYFFHRPTNIVSIPVTVVDPYDITLDLLGMDISITLEIKEVLNSSLYETMRAH